MTVVSAAIARVDDAARAVDGFVPDWIRLESRVRIPADGFDMTVSSEVPLNLLDDLRLPATSRRFGTDFGGVVVDQTALGRLTPRESGRRSALAEALSGIDLIEHAVPIKPGSKLNHHSRITFEGPDTTLWSISEAKSREIRVGQTNLRGAMRAYLREAGLEKPSWRD